MSSDDLEKGEESPKKPNQPGENPAGDPAFLQWLADENLSLEGYTPAGVTRLLEDYRAAQLRAGPQKGVGDAETGRSGDVEKIAEEATGKAKDLIGGGDPADEPLELYDGLKLEDEAVSEKLDLDLDEEEEDLTLDEDDDAPDGISPVDDPDDLVLGGGDSDGISLVDGPNPLTLPDKTPPAAGEGENESPAIPLEESPEPPPAEILSGMPPPTSRVASEDHPEVTLEGSVGQEADAGIEAPVAGEAETIDPVEAPPTRPATKDPTRLQKYRRSRARWGKTGRTIDRGVRSTAAAGVTGVAAWWPASWQITQNALNVGGVLSSSIANGFCIGAPVAPLLYPVGCRIVAKRRHGAEQEEAFYDCQESRFRMTQVEVEENVREFRQELGQSTVELINEPGEQELLAAFHAAMRKRLANIPHLVTDERYAQFCFTQLVMLCDTAAAKAEAARNDHEKILVPYSASQLVDAGSDRLKPDAQAPLSHLRQVAIAYGKVLAERERSEREGLITGAIAGASTGMLFAYGPLAPIVGGAAWAGRRMWRKHREGQVHIEINDRGELEGKSGQPIYNPTTYRSDVPSLYRGGDFVAQAEDDAVRKEWSDETNVKRWLKSIVIPAESVRRCRTGAIRTPSALALETGPRVQAQLQSLKIKFRPPVNTKDVREKELEVEAAVETLKNLRAQKNPSAAALTNASADVTRERKALSDLKNPPEGADLTLEEIGRDENVCKAFAVAVVNAFQANHKTGWVRKSAGATLAPMGSAVGEAAVEVVVKPVVIGGMAMGGVFLAGKLIGAVGGFAVSTPITLTIGGAVGAYAIFKFAAAAIQNFKWGKGGKDPDKK